MHLKTSITSLTFSLLICFFMVSCDSQPEKTGHGKAPKKIELPNSYKGSPTIQAYLLLKDGLVESDQGKATLNAKKLVASLDKANGPGVETIRENAKKILHAKDIDVQREVFQPLSDAMYEYASNKDMDIKLYRQFCPMAFENKGAFWLSTTEEIYNPYFGKKMLHCGVVKEEM